MTAGRRCTICQHDQREAIDLALASGDGVRTIADRFRLSHQSVIRHRNAHIPTAAMRAAAIATEVAEHDHGGNVVAQVRELQRTALRLLTKAEAAGDLRTALAGVREAARCSELVAKLLGDLDESTTINLTLAPQWITLQTTILQALAPHPEARSAVVAALGRVQ